jgi:hypothetical protein
LKPQASPKIRPAMAEPETVRLARAGDSEAFAALYNEHRVEVHTYISRRVHNADLADDLTQDVFVRALRRLSTFSWQGPRLRRVAGHDRPQHRHRPLQAQQHPARDDRRGDA